MALRLNTTTVTFFRIDSHHNLPVPMRCAYLLCSILAAGAVLSAICRFGPCVNFSVSLLVNNSINMIALLPIEILG